MADGLERSGATARLAAFAVSTAGDEIPATVLAKMRVCLLDWFGNTVFAAQHADSAPSVRQGIAAFAGTEPGAHTVAGEPGRRSLSAALLLNGTFGHSLDFDDTNLFGKIHPGVTVIPAALAEAERTHTNGGDLLAAIALGYEVACRVGAALGEATYTRGFHPTPLGGIFGAVAAMGRLRGFDAAQMQAAFGLAGSRAAGSMQYLENGAWNKRLHTGFAAHDAALCVALAEAGVIGAAAALEGRAGVLTSYSPAPRPDLLTDGFGTFWAAAETAIKPYPNCRLNHSAIEAALLLRETLAAPQEESYALRLGATAYRMVGEPLPLKRAAQNIVDGQFSVYFQIAASLIDGRNDWNSYRLLGDAEVNRIAARIEVTEDVGLALGEAVLTPKSAPELAVHIREPLGEPTRPLSWDSVCAKFTSLAAGPLGADRAAQLAAGVATVDTLTDTAPLIALAGAPA
ncbi:MmgE/PrpD family protein [Pseudochelatococcus lubricantis]|uniref:MmgE/PrpD family protein n=1 Tax=Pseudochelatococcus lubricantis TaxID=1538102 RepID=UPI0035EEF778